MNFFIKKYITTLLTISSFSMIFLIQNFKRKNSKLCAGFQSCHSSETGKRSISLNPKWDCIRWAGSRTSNFVQVLSGAGTTHSRRTAPTGTCCLPACPVTHSAEARAWQQVLSLRSWLMNDRRCATHTDSTTQCSLLLGIHCTLRIRATRRIGRTHHNRLVVCVVYRRAMRGPRQCRPLGIASPRRARSCEPSRPPCHCHTIPVLVRDRARQRWQRWGRRSSHPDPVLGALVAYHPYPHIHHLSLTRSSPPSGICDAASKNAYPCCHDSNWWSALLSILLILYHQFSPYL
jgi:hypothetical protein